MSGDNALRHDEKEPAVRFLDYMCAQDCAFSSVEKQLGKFVAVLFYLREFEKFLKKSPQNTNEGVREQPTTSPVCKPEEPASTQG